MGIRVEGSGEFRVQGSLEGSVEFRVQGLLYAFIAGFACEERVRTGPPRARTEGV